MMAEVNNTNRSESMDEIMNRKKMGDKRFHSETSLQHFEEAEANKDFQTSTPIRENDPGVQNATVARLAVVEDTTRKRTHSQPGPVSGGLITATAARAARKKVNYAANELPTLIIPITDSGTASPTGDRGSQFPNNPNFVSGNFQRNDLKALTNYRMYNSAPGTPRKRSTATMDAQSIRSVETQAPPPTSAEDNKRQTRTYLTMIISSMYAILLVTLGLIIHVGDIFVEFPASSAYSLILASVSFLYHMYLIIDIQKYKNAALQNQKIKTKYEEKMNEYFNKQEAMVQTAMGNFQTDNFGMNFPGDDGTPEYKPGMPPPILKPLQHDYCFNTGRHSGSFYLKLGAAGFALGNLVHCVLLIAVQISYLLDETINNDDCVEYSRVALDIIYPLYCFVQLYFVFKYANVIILRSQGLARFAFMHIIGSNLCFWISSIVRETLLALTIYAQYQYTNGYGADTATIETVYRVNASEAGHRFDISGLYEEECVGGEAITAIFENFSPYLYPFSVEFNILIVAVYYIIWSNIGECGTGESGSEINNSLEDNFSVCKIPTANEENDFTSNIVIHADCHASNKGLFGGLMVMVLIVGMLIIGFVLSSVGGDFLEYGYLINNIIKLSLHSIMLFASILAFTQTTKLDINEHPISLLDDILLFVCLPPFFMEAVFSLIATVTILNIVTCVDFIVMIIQVLIQTPLIIDALRRCSNSRKLRRRKPARELIMFLLITNVGMWVFYTFSYKSPESLDERYEFYGKELWTILGHVSLPLIMFYRFHSSVCFADIWDSAYKPGAEH